MLETRNAPKREELELNEHEVAMLQQEGEVEIEEPITNELKLKVLHSLSPDEICELLEPELEEYKLQIR